MNEREAAEKLRDYRDDLRIGRIRYFISVVDERNFTRAAQKCYISQSAISQQIANLEDELGVTLIDRSGKQIRPTECGQFFYKNCKRLLDDLESIIINTKGIHNQSSRLLRIGYSGPVEYVSVLSLAEELRAMFPDLSLSFTKATFNELGDLLLSGRIDMVFAFKFELSSSDKVESLTLVESPMVALVNSRHVLADRGAIPAVELKDHDITMISPKFGSVNYHTMKSHCRADGYEPRIVKEVDSLEALCLEVAFGDFVTIAPREYPLSDIHNIRAVELIGTHHICRIDASWLKDTTNEYINAAARLLKNRIERAPENASISPR